MSPGFEIFGTKIFSKTFIFYFEKWKMIWISTYEVDVNTILNISEASEE